MEVYIEDEKYYMTSNKKIEEKDLKDLDIDTVSIYKDAIEVRTIGCGCCSKDFQLHLLDSTIEKLIEKLDEQKKKLVEVLNWDSKRKARRIFVEGSYWTLHPQDPDPE